MEDYEKELEKFYGGSVALEIKNDLTKEDKLVTNVLKVMSIHKIRRVLKDRGTNRKILLIGIIYIEIIIDK